MPRQLALASERLTRHQRLAPAQLLAGKRFQARYFTQASTSELCSRSTPAGQLCFKWVNMHMGNIDFRGACIWQVFSTLATLAGTGTGLHAKAQPE